MKSEKATAPTGAPRVTEDMPIPWPPRIHRPKSHWWYALKRAEAPNSPPRPRAHLPEHSNSPPNNYSILSQSPSAGGDDIDSAEQKRRGSSDSNAAVHFNDYFLN